MTAARAYAFDTVFDADGGVLREGARARLYTFDEVEQERAASYAAGREDEAGRAARETATALTQIAAAARDLADRTGADRRATMADAAKLALAAARKAAGAALERFGEVRVSTALEEAFETFVSAPRLVLRVAPQLADARERLESIARDHGFDGALIVRADPAVRVGDVILDWGDGAIAHDSAEALTQIEALVAAALAQDETP
jgi:flagellar assembly protein FliH